MDAHQQFEMLLQGGLPAQLPHQQQHLHQHPDDDDQVNHCDVRSVCI